MNPTEILVRVTTTEDRPLWGAEVTITSGGGSFGGRPRSFERTPRRRSSGISGWTDREGVFKAVWSCERCAPAYVLGIRVVRKGYMEAATELEIKVSR